MLAELRDHGSGANTIWFVAAIIRGSGLIVMVRMSETSNERDHVIERARWFISDSVMIVEDVSTRRRIAIARSARAALLLLLAIAAGCAGRSAVASCPAAPAAPVTSTAPAPMLKPSSEALAVLAKLEGEWRGTGEGEPGTSTVERTYRWVLGGRYLEVRNRSSYAPQPKNPQGEQHDDLGLVSYDKNRKKLVFRQFHGEGFVNQYILESGTPDMFVFTSEAIENIPSGFRARETLRFLGDGQLEETFEIAEPNKEFEVYSRNMLTKAASPTR